MIWSAVSIIIVASSHLSFRMVAASPIALAVSRTQGSHMKFSGGI